VLEKLKARQVHRIARLASSARDARDASLHGVGDELAGEPHPAKGEGDRTGAGGFDVAPTDNQALRALRQAISGLPSDARPELFALMRIGQGELAPANWPRGLSEAAALGDNTVRGILGDDIDLSNHLNKGLYELTRQAER